LKVAIKKTDSVGFEIIFSSNEFQINVDRVNEALDLSFDEFEKNRLMIRDTLRAPSKIDNLLVGQNFDILPLNYEWNI
jgi:hypothetical protein